MVLLLLTCAAVGLGSYAIVKRKRRREIANGNVTYYDNGQYGNPREYRDQPQTRYYNTGTR
jgi:hypothetical protein